MLTIDCKDVSSVQNELLVYVADRVEAIPTLKNQQFTLSTLDDDDVLDIEVLLPKKEVQLEIVRQYEESLQQYFEMLNGAYRNVAEAKGYIEKELLGNFSEIPVIEELKLNANEIVVDD